MNNCPHCGAEDNTSGTFLCGTQYVGTETFRSQQCRDRVTSRQRSKDQVSHIPDTGKMVGETPISDRTPHNVAELGMLCRRLERELREVQSENTRLRAALANSNGACVYCTLPKEQWAKCRSGFPGCARADDAMGCPELGAALALQEAQERIRLLIAERDSARQQADLNWKMREEFAALLGTDDVKEAVRELKLMKAQKISTTQTK